MSKKKIEVSTKKMKKKMEERENKKRKLPKVDLKERDDSCKVVKLARKEEEITKEKDAKVVLVKQVFSSKESDNYLEILLNEIEWKEEEIVMMGKKVVKELFVSFTFFN